MTLLFEKLVPEVYAHSIFLDRATRVWRQT